MQIREFALYFSFLTIFNNGLGKFDLGYSATEGFWVHISIRLLHGIILDNPDGRDGMGRNTRERARQFLK